MAHAPGTPREPHDRQFSRASSLVARARVYCSECEWREHLGTPAEVVNAGRHHVRETTHRVLCDVIHTRSYTYRGPRRNAV